MLYDSIHMKVQNREIYKDQQYISGYLRLWARVEKSRWVSVEVNRVFSWGDENVLKLTVVMIACVYEYI